MATKSIPAGLFKQGCLALLDEVQETNVELVVTKRGKPVARVVPVADERKREHAILERLRSRVRAPIGRTKDLLEPTSSLARWKLKPGPR